MHVPEQVGAPRRPLHSLLVDDGRDLYNRIAFTLPAATAAAHHQVSEHQVVMLRVREVAGDFVLVEEVRERD